MRIRTMASLFMLLGLAADPPTRAAGTDARARQGAYVRASGEDCPDE